MLSMLCMELTMPCCAILSFFLIFLQRRTEQPRFPGGSKWPNQFCKKIGKKDKMAQHGTMWSAQGGEGFLLTQWSHGLETTHLVQHTVGHPSFSFSPTPKEALIKALSSIWFSKVLWATCPQLAMLAGTARYGTERIAMAHGGDGTVRLWLTVDERQDWKSLWSISCWLALGSWYLLIKRTQRGQWTRRRTGRKEAKVEMRQGRDKKEEESQEEMETKSEKESWGEGSGGELRGVKKSEGVWVGDSGRKVRWALQYPHWPLPQPRQQASTQVPSSKASAPECNPFIPLEPRAVLNQKP